MIEIRRSRERGHFDHGWLDTYHTFSFADYHDPRFMGFRALRVINEDRVKPGEGFGTHGHRDMEIITYVMSGELAHKDSMGNGSVIGPGEVQYMAAGTGVEHSEFNPSKLEAVHLMQIWIRPDRRGLAPRYEQRLFPSLSETGALTMLASADGRNGSIRINQDAALYAASLAEGQTVEHALGPGRAAWLQVLRGTASLNEEILKAGDGAGVSETASVRVTAASEAEFLLFDLA
ncbi:MAG TPA: pirin family protein [Phycisphaerae bacterium]|nr:pirin family protein [Phycisphaerae bacterium]